MFKHIRTYRIREGEITQVQVRDVDVWKNKYNIITVDFLPIYEVCVACGEKVEVQVDYWT